MGILADIETNIISSDVYLLRNRIFEKMWYDYTCVYSCSNIIPYMYSHNMSWIFMGIKSRLDNLCIYDLYKNFNFSMEELKMFCDFNINDGIKEVRNINSYCDSVCIIGNTRHNTLRRKPIFFVFKSSYNNTMKYIETGKLKIDIECDYLPISLSTDMYDIINGTSMFYDMLPDILNMEVSMNSIDRIIDDMHACIMEQKLTFSNDFYEDLKKFILSKLNN